MIKTAHDIIIRPVITEKSMAAMAQNKFTFEVMKSATKIDIKKAIEELYEGVKVEKVATINVRGRLKRMGRYEGYTSDWKKAIVTLAADSAKIPFFEGLN